MTPALTTRRRFLGRGAHVLGLAALMGGRPLRTLADDGQAKESADAARAVTAAMPLLAKAERAIFTSVAEKNDDLAEAMNDIVRQFAWSGVAAEAKVIAPDGRAPEDLLAAAAKDCNADLVVMGAYSHSRIREILFGGCTKAFITHAEVPILLLH